MKDIRPTCYSAFRCIASSCKDNCCIGWEIDIDPETAAAYRRVPGAFGGRLRGAMTEGETPSFRLEAERCPFLNGENLCGIILTLGEDRLCSICTEHPRFHEWYGPFSESGLGLCCEEAVRLTLLTPFALESAEEEGEADPPEPLFDALLKVRQTAFSLLSDRSFPLSRRLGALLVFAHAVQDALDSIPASPERVASLAESPGPWLNLGPLPPADAGEGIRDILSFLAGLEPLDPGWPAHLKKLEEKAESLLPLAPELFAACPERKTDYERVALSLAFRYLLKAWFDLELLPKAKFIPVALLVLLLSDLERFSAAGALTLPDRITAVTRFSKELEYSEENMEAFWEKSWEAPFDTLPLAGFLAALPF